jgi:ADP-heptose:LPS heptosyltransferase
MPKVLVLKRDKIGDMLLMTPMLEHLRNSLPGVEIHVLANDYNAWVVEGNPNIDHLWVYPRTRHAGRVRPFAAICDWLLTRKLRGMAFDAVIAAGGGVSPRALMRALRLQGKRTIGYVDPAHVPSGMSDPQPAPAHRALHEVEANIALLAPLGIAPPAAPLWPIYRPPQQWIDAGREWVRQNGLENGFVTIGVNARRDKRKPSHDQIRRWSDAILARHGLHTVLVWQPGPADSALYPGDDERMADIAANPPAHLHPFRSGQDILPLLGILWHSRATVLPDGGLAHLASASPGGVLALFAETDVSPHPDNWRPWSPRGHYLEAGKTVAELDDEAVLGFVSMMIQQSA